MKEVSLVKQEFILNFFKALDSKSKYCILRNYENYPEKMGDDIDIAIDSPSDDVVNDVVLPIINELGWDYYVKFRQDGFTPIICMFTTNDTVDTCQIDVYTRFLWRGNLFADAKAVLDSRIKYKNFWVASHGADMAITITKEYMGSGKVRSKYRTKMAQYSKDDKENFYAVLCDIYGREMTDKLYQYCLNNQFDKIDSMAKTFKRKVRNHNMGIFINRSISGFINRVKHWFCPEGKIIAFVGPDGSGKTTLIGKMDDYMERLFPHNSKIYHRRYELFPELHTGLGLSSMKGKISSGKPGTEIQYSQDNVKRKRSFLSKMAAMFVVLYYTMEYVIGNIVAYRLVVKRTLILYDRYYYDHFVQPTTRDVIWPFRYLLLGLVRKPDLVIHLIASGSHIFKRKQDLNPVEIDNQNFYMSRVLKCCKNVEELNMESLNAEQVAAEVFRISVNKLFGFRPKENSLNI